MDKESLKLLLAQGLSVERIGERFGKHPSTVSYWMAKHGLEANRRHVHAAKGGIEREQLEELVQAGMTIAEIAAVVGLSKATVRHWLKRYSLRTEATQRRAAAREARADGMLTIGRRCPSHGETEFVIEGRGYYRCKRCRNESITDHRRRLKRRLVEEAGGRCALCGYDRCIAALEFHHLDPVEKRLGISAGGLTLSLDVLQAEAAKCVLICSNCHAEVENGIVTLPVECSTTPVLGPDPIHQNAG